ncbi:hypothetical protein J2T09_003896 [Neorhizobium huautlense]|uniref:Uncharacterized protein n=1 Tax=Neorhizobium huautlense TaxID=67774 RepID=A0ABT9PYD0_9HYPH|nr:hypothetical protein [Neorhizobium huautlense]MDP9839121.1 hypothetical protein [Neorhizobium huautlense]
MTINAISSLQRSLYTGNDAALLVTPAMGSSATTMPSQPLIPESELETGFQNDTGNPGQPRLAKIVEILDLMRPLQKNSTGDVTQNPSHDDSVRAVSAFLDGLEEDAIFSTPAAPRQTDLQDLYRQF